MRIVALFSLVTCTFFGCSADRNTESWLTLDRDTYEKLHFNFGDAVSLKSQTDKFVTFRTDDETVQQISKTIHHISNRCGGFFASESEADAAELMSELNSSQSWDNPHHYKVRGNRVVDHFLSKIDANQIQASIHYLSNKFNSRYYKSETGSKSQAWLAQTWRSMNVRRRKDFNVKLYEHSSWSQPSVIGSITGQKYPDEIIVIGGHGDSIAGMFGSIDNRSPGADDNASGISSVTEALRVILSSTYVPSRTIVFMSYAAEEVGLRGSREIAKAYKEAGKKVVAVMQLDMTNHRTEDGVISFIRDHTDDKLTLFTQGLANRYLPEVNWTDDKCGYACSDHASWNAAGFPAVFPFESRVSKMNGKIHTKNDTLENSDRTAQHASIFAKLALAFAMETAQ